MAQTVISRGDALAVKYFGAALFAEAMRKSTFRRKLIGPAPKQSKAVAKMRKRSSQTSYDMPIVSITDLNEGMGDSVSIDLFGALVGIPIMGDKKAAGRGIPLKKSSMDLTIDQMRQVTDPGGKMTQHRTIYDLRMICKANLTEWFGRLLDQLCVVHMAGARGDDDGEDWCIPLESHPEFDEIVVNPLLPPSPNRRFFAGNATTLANGATGAIAATDILTLEDISKVRNAIDNMVLPPSPIKLGMPDEDEDPLYLMFVTPNQWFYIENSVKKYGNDWRSWQVDALRRGTATNHPLFKGGTNMALWNNILIRKYPRRIRFSAGSTVRQYNAAGTAISDVTVPAGVTVERAIILGSQALAEAWGNARPGGDNAPMRWVEEWTDGRNALEIFGSLIGGFSKIKFYGTDSVPTDFGVMTLDSHAPDPATTAGATALGAVQDTM